MMRGLFALPLLAVGLGLVMLALLLGGRAATTTETEVIERLAARYVAAGGGARSDCHAAPARSQALWLVVVCEARDGTGMTYFVDRFGRVADTRRLEPGAT